MHFIPEVNHSRLNSLIPTIWTALVCLVLGLLAAGCTQPVVQRPITEVPQAIENTTEQRAYAAMESGAYLAGIRLYEQVLRKDPGNAKALYMLGYAYGQLGEIESEIAYYRAAVQAGYRTEQIFHNLGKACLAVNRPEEAIAAFDSGLSFNPLSADNHFGLGMAYQKKSEDDAARKEFVTAIRIAPDVLEFREYLGLFYEETGHLDQAAEQFRKILERDPQYEGAREHLEHLVRQKNLKEGRTGTGGQ